MVHPDGVGSELFHQSNIKLTLFGVDQGIVGNKLIGDA